MSKNKKVVKDKALLFIIDGFKISLSSAKEIYDLRFDTLSDDESLKLANKKSEEFTQIANFQNFFNRQ